MESVRTTDRPPFRVGMQTDTSGCRMGRATAGSRSQRLPGTRFETASPMMRSVIVEPCEGEIETASLLDALTDEVAG